MLFIIEGPDGAGKTTFIQTLSKELYRAGRWNVLTSPHASPIESPFVEYCFGLDFYRPGGNRDLILDRSWLSEEVYGPRWRGKGLPPGDLDKLNTWAVDLGALVIFLDAPDTVLVRRVLKERGDDLVTTAEAVIDLAVGYRNLDHRLPARNVAHCFWPYDPPAVATQAIALATQLDSQAFLTYKETPCPS